jgi:hypothetical protein
MFDFARGAKSVLVDPAFRTVEAGDAMELYVVAMCGGKNLATRVSVDVAGSRPASQGRCLVENLALVITERREIVDGLRHHLVDAAVLAVVGHAQPDPLLSAGFPDGRKAAEHHQRHILHLRWWNNKNAIGRTPSRSTWLT